MNLTGIGLYTLQQAARITGADPREVNRWLFGYKAKGDKAMPPLWQTQIQGVEDKVIGFRDVMELRVVKAFIDHNVPVRVIRTAIRNARDLLNTEYPFTSTRFLTDGKSIFHEAVNNEGFELTDLARRQIVFESVIRPELYAGIEFSADGAARRWFPLKNKIVVLDPELSFGRPSLTKFGIPTDVLAQAVRVEKDPKLVAAQFDIPVAEVRAAVKYENQLLAA